MSEPFVHCTAAFTWIFTYWIMKTKIHAWNKSGNSVMTDEKLLHICSCLNQIPVLNAYMVDLFTTLSSKNDNIICKNNIHHNTTNIKCRKRYKQNSVAQKKSSWWWQMDYQNLKKIRYRVELFNNKENQDNHQKTACKHGILQESLQVFWNGRYPLLSYHTSNCILQ